MPFGRRGALLDEHLAAWEGLWRDTPASFAGEHYAYEDVYFEPKAWRPDGPRLWLGGESVHPRLLRRIVRYAHGFHPARASRPTPTWRSCATASPRRAATSRSSSSSAACVPSSRTTHSPSPLEPAIASIPAQLGPRIHDVLHQAVPVRRRHRRSTRPGAARSSSAWRRSTHERRRRWAARSRVEQLERLRIALTQADPAAEDAARRVRSRPRASIEFADLRGRGSEQRSTGSARPTDSSVTRARRLALTGYGRGRSILGLDGPPSRRGEARRHRSDPIDADDRGSTRRRAAAAPFDAAIRRASACERFAEPIEAEAEACSTGSRRSASASSAAPFCRALRGADAAGAGLSLDDVTRIDGFYSAFAGAIVYEGNPRAAAARRRRPRRARRRPRSRSRPLPHARRTHRSRRCRERRGLGRERRRGGRQLRVIMFGGIETIQRRS